jgi:hypothetical protein
LALPRGAASSTYSGVAARARTLAGKHNTFVGEAEMTPLMMRIFTLVGIALAAASMQLKARADSQPDAPAVQAVASPGWAGVR